MITRIVSKNIEELLDEFPAVGILGPRQVGKTTLAESIAEASGRESLYLGLESPVDLAKLSDSEAFFYFQKGKLIILDEIQRLPEIFAVLRSVIDRRRKEGLKTGQFLVLGSASLELLQQYSESLAGGIAYQQLSGITIEEYSETQKLWFRGGFPDSLLAKSEAASMRWRQSFITTYLERDVPQIGPRIPATTLRRLWTMLAHNHGTQLNQAQLAKNLDVSVPTIKRYVDLLEDLFLVRSIRPWSGNVGKRLVKTPKVYIRDSGITHALLNIGSFNELLGHPVVGTSWEGFVIENLISCLADGNTFWYYRTSVGAEIDLVIEKGSNEVWAIEIKKSLAPTVSKGFYIACEDIKATHRFLVYSGSEVYPAAHGVMVMPVLEMMKKLRLQ